MDNYFGTGVRQPKGGIFIADSTAQKARPFQLKRFFRLQYPPQARPKVLDIDCDVMDLSIKGIKFAWNRRSYQCPESLTINNPVNLKIRFGDGTIAEIEVKILRCFEDIELGKTCFAGSIIRGMSQRRIDRELAYIRRHFVDFHKQQTAAVS